MPFVGKVTGRPSILEGSIDDMINEGYLKATQILRTIFSQGYDNLEYIYNVIDYMNLTSDKRSLRITGDVLVTNFNKFTQKFTKK